MRDRDGDLQGAGGFLGTPEKDKRHVIYETGHAVPRKEFIRESLDWLDKYLPNALTMLATGPDSATRSPCVNSCMPSRAQYTVTPKRSTNSPLDR